MGTLILNGVRFENISMDIIANMVAERLVYLGVDGCYHEGTTLKDSEMDFSDEIDALRSDSSREYNLD